MMILPRYFFICSLLVLQVYCYNILMISPLVSLSHNGLMKKLAEGLAIRGHQVVFLSHFPMDKTEGITHISLAENSVRLAFTEEFFRFSFGLLVDRMILKPGHKQCALLYQSAQFRELKNTKKKYDLFVTDLYTSECLLPWAWYFDIPSVTVTASIPITWNNERFAVPDNPSYTPTYFGGYGAKMSLLERGYNVWQYVVSRYKFWKSSKTADQIARAFFGPEMPPLAEVAYNTSLLLSNSHFSIHDARALPPNVIEIGGLHIGQPKPVPMHLDKVLNSNPRGVIYFSMGTIVAAETFSDKLLQGILDAFVQMPYGVLFRVGTENLSKKLKIPDNVYLEDWVPQLDLLCDPRVKLFFSHGGMMGMQESIYCGVPVLTLPVIIDQRHNSRHAEIMGFGLELPDASTNSILEACEKLLNDPKYSENAKRVSREFMDRPMSPTDTAVFWTEYVVRHQGAPKMQSHAKRLAWYQYYMLDILGLVVGSLVVVLYVLSLVVRFALNRREKKKVKKN